MRQVTFSLSQETMKNGLNACLTIDHLRKRTARMSIVGKRLDRVLAAGDPGGIACAQDPADERNQRGADDPVGCDQDGKRWKRSKKQGAPDVADGDAHADADRANQD